MSNLSFAHPKKKRSLKIFNGEEALAAIIVCLHSGFKQKTRFYDICQLFDWHTFDIIAYKLFTFLSTLYKREGKKID